MPAPIGYWVRGPTPCNPRVAKYLLFLVALLGVQYDPPVLTLFANASEYGNGLIRQF
jgi:hypothetical protein